MKTVLSCFKSDMFKLVIVWGFFLCFLHSEWDVTVFWAPQLCLMLVVCVKETTPPARHTKDSTPSSITQTVRLSSYLFFVHGFDHVKEVFP